MDQEPRSSADDYVVTGLGHVVAPRCDPARYLKSAKSRKFMGVQDDLAVVAAGIALENAGLTGGLGERAGLYLAVGHIAFEQRDAEDLLAGCIDDGGLSMRLLSTIGFHNLNPLLTFRCLSNMPAFHISTNFDIQGPYFVTYPGPGQFYIALQQAYLALADGLVDIAIAGGVAYQSNFLVEHHFRRAQPPAAGLVNAGGCIVLETRAHAQLRAAPGWAVLRELHIEYRPHDPFEETLAPVETGADSAMGPASLPVALSLHLEGPLQHELISRDGIRASSAWELEGVR